MYIIHQTDTDLAGLNPSPQIGNESPVQTSSSSQAQAYSQYDESALLSSTGFEECGMSKHARSVSFYKIDPS